MNTGLPQRNPRTTPELAARNRQLHANEAAAGLRLRPDPARIRAKADAIKNALRGCGGREMEMLIRYYAGGQDLDRVAEETGASIDELAVLAERLRRVARLATARAATASR